MAKRRFIFFTKTVWSEPPRLRHQIAQLLASDGNEIIFCERPVFPLQNSYPSVETAGQSGITLFRHRELLHHRLAVTGALRALGALFTRRSIMTTLGACRVAPADVIVNFNYEYDFLRKLFPANIIITVINDDFVNKVPPVFRRSFESVQQRTCKLSDAVLTPSSVIASRLASCCSPELFLPWADVEYSRPVAGPCRDTILYWGYVDRRLDFKLLKMLAKNLEIEMPSVRLMFVGPVGRAIDSHAFFHEHRNVTRQAATPLGDLHLERVFASIIPYTQSAEWRAIVMPNKAFQLLARGIPLVISGMPEFAEADFIFRMRNEDPTRAIQAVREQFDAVQDPIRAYLEANDADSRLKQFQSILSRAESKRRPR
jgi:hypothetical protein